MKGCDLPRQIDDPASAGKDITITFYIVESGKLSQIRSSDGHLSPPVLYGRFSNCQFGIFEENGQALPYYANIMVRAR